MTEIATAELAQRLIDAERDCMVDWIEAMAALPGNPLKATVAQFGAATAVVCGAIPAQVYNRVFHMTWADRAHLPAILALYRDYAAEPLFDLSPYAMAPFWEGPNLARELAGLGFYQGAFHQMLYGAPAADVPPPPAHLTIAEAGPDDAETFGRVYDQVWGGSASIRVLIGHPQFRCYLAHVDGQPAALGMMHIANGAASMANGLTIPALRGRGCHTALLHQRIRDAALAGCDLLVSQCRPGSDSQRNQMRAGFGIAGTKAWWVPL